MSNRRSLKQVVAYCREKHWYWWKFVVLLIAAAFLAVMLDRFQAHSDYFTLKFNSFFNDLKKIEYTLEDASIYDYEVSGDTLTSQSEDPYFIINHNGYVGNITVQFSKPLTESVFVAVYYSLGDAAFTQENVVLHQIEKGDTEFSVFIGQNTTSLRFDLGVESGITLSLESICVNSDITSFSEVLFDFWKDFSFDRIQIFFLLFAFLGLYFIFGWKTLNNWLFRYRWVVAGAVFLFLVLNQYHFSSIGMYDKYIQPGEGSKYIEPIFGEARAIRSDEWLVTTPQRLSTEFAGHGAMNSIVRGVETPNITASAGIQLGYSAFANIFLWGYYLFGTVYGLSICWSMMFVLSFMIPFEFFYIISKKKRLPALVGGGIVGLSAFVFWWSISTNFLFPLAIVICLYYFLQTNKLYVKILCGIATALAGANFVSALYPAWQVPVAYVLLGLLAWLVISNWERVKKLRLQDYCLIAAGLLFMGSIILAFLHDSSYYIEAVSETLYPGQRVSSGGYALTKIYNYVPAALLSKNDIGNPSEVSTMITFFPLPIIMLVYQMIRGKKKDSLSIILLMLSVFIGTYCIIGWPMWLAEITLMTYTTAGRCVDIFIFIQAIILVVVISRHSDAPKLPWYLGIPLSAGTVGWAFYSFISRYPGYMSWKSGALFGILYFVICSFICTRLPEHKVWKKLKNASFAILVLISAYSALSVNPLMKGLDVIYSKPAAKTIQEIVSEEPDSKWVCTNNISSSFAIINGAPTISSVNNIPNMDLWKKLDPQGKYEEVYNRYAHVFVTFVEGETYFELIGADAFNLYLNYQDIILTDCKYIFTQAPLEGGLGVRFIELYNEAGCYIYQVDFNGETVTS